MASFFLLLFGGETSCFSFKRNCVSRWSLTCETMVPVFHILDPLFLNLLEGECYVSGRDVRASFLLWRFFLSPLPYSQWARGGFFSCPKEDECSCFSSPFRRLPPRFSPSQRALRVPSQISCATSHTFSEE